MPLAMIGMAAASIIGGMMSADAAEEASSQSAQASREASAMQLKGVEESIAFQKEMYAQNKAIYNENAPKTQPYITEGTSANKLYADLTGANGSDAQATALKNYQASPYLKQMMDNASTQTMASAGKAGQGVSGNVLQALYSGASDTYNTAYNNYLSNLSGLSTQGLQGLGVLSGMEGAIMGSGNNAANAVSNSLITGTNNAAQSTQNAGNAQAAGTMGSSNALSGSLNNLSNLYMFNQAFGKGGNALSF